MRVAHAMLALAVTAAPASAAAQVQSSFDLIYFARDSANLDELDDEPVRAAVEWLRNHPDGRLVVEGHADQSGSAGYNLALSRRRAETVRDALVAAGVPRAKLAVVAAGETEPVGKVAARNRRVRIWATTF